MTFLGGLAGLAVDAMARPATRIRAAVGSYVGGKWQAGGAPISDQIRAAIRAPSESDIRQLPDGERTEAYVTIWTRADLVTADEDSGRQADEITGEQGQTYKVVRVVERTEAGFTRAIARLVSDGRGRRV
jgi:hypothetical protein